MASFQTRKVIPRGIRRRKTSTVESTSSDSCFSSSLPEEQTQTVTARKGHKCYDTILQHLLIWTLSLGMEVGAIYLLAVLNGEN